MAIDPKTGQQLDPMTGQPFRPLVGSLAVNGAGLSGVGLGAYGLNSPPTIDPKTGLPAAGSGPETKITTNNGTDATQSLLNASNATNRNQTGTRDQSGKSTQSNVSATAGATTSNGLTQDQINQVTSLPPEARAAALAQLGILPEQAAKLSAMFDKGYTNAQDLNTAIAASPGYTDAEAKAQQISPEQEAAMVSQSGRPVAGAAENAKQNLLRYSSANGNFNPGLNATLERVQQNQGRQAAEAAQATHLGVMDENRKAAQAAADARVSGSRFADTQAGVLAGMPLQGQLTTQGQQTSLITAFPEKSLSGTGSTTTSNEGTSNTQGQDNATTDSHLVDNSNLVDNSTSTDVKNTTGLDTSNNTSKVISGPSTTGGTLLNPTAAGGGGGGIAPKVTAPVTAPVVNPPSTVSPTNPFGLPLKGKGGPVGQGRYIVGEKGPEILDMAPGSSGYVHPHKSLLRMNHAALPGKAAGGEVDGLTPYPQSTPGTGYGTTPAGAGGTSYTSENNAHNLDPNVDAQRNADGSGKLNPTAIGTEMGASTAQANDVWGSPMQAPKLADPSLRSKVLGSDMPAQTPVPPPMAPPQLADPSLRSKVLGSGMPAQLESMSSIFAHGGTERPGVESNPTPAPMTPTPNLLNPDAVTHQPNVGTGRQMMRRPSYRRPTYPNSGGIRLNVY